MPLQEKNNERILKLRFKFGIYLLRPHASRTAMRESDGFANGDDDDDTADDDDANANSP